MRINVLVWIMLMLATDSRAGSFMYEDDGLPIVEKSSPGVMSLDTAAAECDRLAAHPEDPDRPAGIVGVFFENVHRNAINAIQYCLYATEKSSVARFYLQLARSYLSIGDQNNYNTNISAAAEAGSMLSKYILAQDYEDGVLRERDLFTARKLYRDTNRSKNGKFNIQDMGYKRYMDALDVYISQAPRRYLELNPLNLAEESTHFYLGSDTIFSIYIVKLRELYDQNGSASTSSERKIRFFFEDVHLDVIVEGRSVEVMCKFQKCINETSVTTSNKYASKRESTKRESTINYSIKIEFSSELVASEVGKNLKYFIIKNNTN